MLAAGRGEQFAGAGEDIHLQHRFVWQTVAERRRLDTQAADRTAQGDGLQLRDHQRRKAVRQGRGHQVLVRAHAGHVGGAGFGIDTEDTGQPRGIQAGGVAFGAGAEQI